MGPLMPNETGDGTYQVAVGVYHPERFEAYAWFTIDATGKITVSVFTLDRFDAPASPSPQALQSFKRLCAAD